MNSVNIMNESYANSTIGYYKPDDDGDIFEPGCGGVKIILSKNNLNTGEYFICKTGRYFTVLAVFYKYIIILPNKPWTHP